jgi:hypothetical protein
MINTSFQTKFLLQLGVVTFFATAVIYGLQSLLGWNLYASAFVGTVVFTYGGIFISAKIAGPVLKMQRHLSHLSKGETDPIHFRQGDYFSEVICEYNSLLENLERPSKLAPGEHPKLTLVKSDTKAA